MKRKDAERIITEIINPEPDLEAIKEINEIGEKLEHIMERKTSRDILPVEERKPFSLDLNIMTVFLALNAAENDLESAEEETEELKKNKDYWHKLYLGQFDKNQSQEDIIKKYSELIKKQQKEIEFLKKDHAAMEESMNHSGNRFLDKCRELAIARQEIEQLKKELQKRG